ncbi:IPT/TIG domain-containing protein [Hymenobacter cellulosilyticus]|uniref:IPT/TIG domain-containing protein n=1 Tax=Hymenobacter cellulosilyticus TaxID=2932248 RepID=UPI0035CC50A5
MPANSPAIAAKVVGSTAPTITSISPTTCPAGTPVTIIGTNLANAVRLWSGHMEVPGSAITVNVQGTQATFTWPRASLPGYGVEYVTSSGAVTSRQVFTTTLPAYIGSTVQLFAEGDSKTAGFNLSNVSDRWVEKAKALVPGIPAASWANVSGSEDMLDPIVGAGQTMLFQYCSPMCATTLPSSTGCCSSTPG